MNNNNNKQTHLHIDDGAQSVAQQQHLAQPIKIHEYIFIFIFIGSLPPPLMEAGAPPLTASGHQRRSLPLSLPLSPSLSLSLSLSAPA